MRLLSVRAKCKLYSVDTSFELSKLKLLKLR